jgi:hypothetical protein
MPAEPVADQAEGRRCIALHDVNGEWVKGAEWAMASNDVLLEPWIVHRFEEVKRTAAVM